MPLKLTAWSPDPKEGENLPYRAGLARASSYTVVTIIDWVLRETLTQCDIIVLTKIMITPSKLFYY